MCKHVLNVLNAENTNPNKVALVFCLVTPINICHIFFFHQTDHLNPLNFPRTHSPHSPHNSSVVSHMDWLWHSQAVNTYEQLIYLQATAVLEKGPLLTTSASESLQPSFFMLSALIPSLPSSYCIPGYFY